MKEKIQSLDTEDFYEASKEESPKLKILMYYDALIARAIKDDASPDQTMSSILSISGVLKVRALVQLKSAKLEAELSLHAEELNQINAIKVLLTDKLLRERTMEYLWKTIDWFAVINVLETKTHVPINVSRTVNLDGIEHQYNLE